MANGDFKDLSRRIAADKTLQDKASNIAIKPKYNGYQCRRASMVYKFIDKKSSGGAIEYKTTSNQRPSDLAKDLHKPTIRKFKKRKVY